MYLQNPSTVDPCLPKPLRSLASTICVQISEQHVDDSDSENFNYFNDTCTYENHKHVMIFTIEFVDSDK